MYDELIAELRQHHCDAKEDDTQEVCEECCYDVIIVDKSAPSGFASVCTCGLMNRAADAIEELSAVLDKFPRWIPVTERLPEEYKDVLCYYEYFRYGDYNCMFRTIDRGYYGNGIWGGEAGQGHKNKVIAWMPLPEPPEEE